MLPFKNFYKVKRGYKFGQPTFYNDFHIGTDYIVPTGTPVYAWDDLEITAVSVGKQGGNTVFCKVIGEVPLVRLLHNRELPKKGKRKEGEIVCYTDNTGLSTGPHSHIDVSINGKLELNNRKNFTDPDKYFPKYETKVIQINTTSVPVMGESNTTATVPVEPIKITVEAPEAESEVQVPIKPPEPKNEVKLGALAELIRLVAKWIKTKLER